MENTKFAQTFRKSNSCDHCRKQKQKCAYSSPDATACIKCVEANVECHITPRQKRTVKKKKPAPGKFAWLENKTVKNQFDREQKIEQLKQVIEEATNELNSMQPFSQEGINNNRENHCVKSAFDRNLVSCAETIQLVHQYKKLFEQYSLITVHVKEDITQISEEEGLLMLAICLAVLITTTTTNTDGLQKFLETLIIERIYINPSPSLFLIKALIIMNEFVRPTDDSRIPTYILLAHAAAVQLDLGNSNDVHSINSSDLDRRDHALERSRVYLALTTSIGIIAMNSQRMAMLDLLPENSRLFDAMLLYGTDQDKLLVKIQKTYLLGRQGCETMASNENKNQPFDTHIKPILACCKARYAELAACPENVPSLFVGCNYTVLLNMYETALNQVIFNKNGADMPTVMPLSLEIMRLAGSLISSFVDQAQKSEKYLPMILYLQPLHGICAMIRLRLLLWTQGIFDNNVPVEENCKRLEQIWPTSNQAGLTMFDSFQRVETFSQLRLKDFRQLCPSGCIEDGPSPTALMLQRVLRDGAAAHVISDYQKSNPSPKCYTADDVFSVQEPVSNNLDSNNNNNNPEQLINQKLPSLSVTDDSPNSSSYTESPPYIDTINNNSNNPSEQDIETTLKEIFSELGSSVYVE